MVQQWKRDGGTVEQRWWNSGLSDGGTVKQSWWNSGTVEQWNSRTSDGFNGRIEMVGQWNRDRGTVEHPKVEK